MLEEKGAGSNQTRGIGGFERYLTLCAEENIQVCNLTTPGQFFHALRRQLKRNLRRPLVIMSPKSLLRSKVCVSPVDELVNGRFREILDDPNPPKKARRLVFCSGKVYYDLIKRRREEELDNVAIIRIEQLYPFPIEKLAVELDKYNAGTFVWCQEEPKNQGAWYTSQHHMRAAIGVRGYLEYAGRPTMAAPAVGYAALHIKQLHSLVEVALGLKDPGVSDGD